MALVALVSLPMAADSRRSEKGRGKYVAYRLSFAGFKVQACNLANPISLSEWNPGGKIGHDQRSGESRATYLSVARLAGPMATS